MTNQPSRQQPLAGVGNCQPNACQAANPIGQGLVGKDPLIGGSAKLPTPDGARVGNANVDEPTLDELATLKTRINTGVAYCHQRVGTPNAAKGHARLLRILSREYLPALDALQEAYPREALEAERDALLARLERGWQMEDSAKVARTFSKLLVRYEVLTDALDGNVINRTLGRVERAAA